MNLRAQVVNQFQMSGMQYAQKGQGQKINSQSFKQNMPNSPTSNDNSNLQKKQSNQIVDPKKNNQLKKNV